MMSFLQPLVGLAVGAGAGAILLLLYFLKLRRRPLRVGSTLLWQRAVHDLEVNQPFQWLRTNRLLFLQLLILALLATALARPLIPNGGESAARLVILVDRSASMAVRDAEQGEARLEAAIRRATEIAREASSSGQTEVLIATYAADLEALTGWTRSRARLTRALASIQQTDQPDDLDLALDRIGPFLLDTSENESNDLSARVVVITDSSDIPASSITADLALETVGGARQAENVGLVAIGARRDFDDPARILLFARLAGTPGAGGIVAVQLLKDGVPVDRTPTELTAQNNMSASVSFETEATDRTVLTVRLSRTDALAADNEASVVIPAITRPATALVTPDDPESDEIVWLTRTVLEALDPERLTVLSSETYEQDPSAVQADAAWIVFDRVTPSAVPSVPSLSLGASLPIDQLETTNPRTPTRVLSWQREHPTLAYAGLGRLLIEQTIGLRVRSADESAEPTESPDQPAARRSVIRELATGQHGPLILEIEDAGVRRIIVGFEPAQSSWPLDEGYAIFLATTLERLSYSGDSGQARAAQTGRPLKVISDGRAIELRSEADDVLEASATGTLGEIEITAPLRTGIYRDAQGRAVAVNLTQEDETLINSSSPTNGEEASIQPDTPTSNGLTGPREVWWWFVFAALGVAAVEWMVYLARTHRAVAGGA